MQRPATALLMLAALATPAQPVSAQSAGIEVTRLDDNPIIRSGMDDAMGFNINGPSLIRVPDWVERPLGRYYLYFSHHKGRYIRLAYADRVEGPWKVHSPGCLALEDSHFPTEPPTIESLSPAPRQWIEAALASGADPDVVALYAHIASPEAVVVEGAREIRLYYHGLLADGSQATRVAVSADGLHFEAREELVSRAYFRAFEWQEQTYGLAMPGVFYRSRDGLSAFEEGPSLFNPDMRHSALLVRDDTLHVFWTQVGDTPERILLSTIDLTQDWKGWSASDPIDVLTSETEWEGAELPIESSQRGAALKPVHQLRDPEIYEENGEIWLLYSVAGERGIAVARVEIVP